MSCYYPARADINLDAIVHNLRTIESALSGQQIMAIVKADAYGHGRSQVARACLNAGVNFFGVAQLGEALTLRDELGAGPNILTWIYAPGAPLVRAIEANIDISVGAFWALEEVEKAARSVGQPARIHLKADTGMARGGFNGSDMAEAARQARKLENNGLARVVGLWSHLARADEPESDFTDVQVKRFEAARSAVSSAGIDVQLHHLAASSGALWHPAARYDMVRPGAALYGISPSPAMGTAAQLNLRGAMQLSATVIVDRTVPAGTGISYGHSAVTDKETRLGVVPLGYEDGIDRMASNTAPLVINGHRTTVTGRVCMDQFVTELPEGAKAGDTAYLFGDAQDGLPTADDWAVATKTIGWEVITRIGARVPRYYHGTGAPRP